MKRFSEKLPVSICIIAHDEEKNIAECLDSVVERAGQVVVLDASSSDRTGEIVKKLYPGVRLLAHPNEKNLNVNKMRSFEAADQEWIFYLDADERFTPELWDEMGEAVENREYNGYRVGRKNMYFGTWLRHGGQYPELQPRLFRRGKGKFAFRHVHEILEIEGAVGDLKEPFIHLTYPTVGLYYQKFFFYADFQAARWYRDGIRWQAGNHLKYGFLRPFGRFVQKFILKAGFRDGFLGFFVAFMQGVSEAASYMLIKDYQEKKRQDEFFGSPS